MSGNGMVRPCSCPASKLSWARGTKDKERAISQTPNTAIAVIGIDIGKNSFHVVGHDERGAIVLRQKWSRGQIEARFANLLPGRHGSLRRRAPSQPQAPPILTRRCHS